MLIILTHLHMRVDPWGNNMPQMTAIDAKATGWIDEFVVLSSSSKTLPDPMVQIGYNKLCPSLIKMDTSRPHSFIALVGRIKAYLTWLGQFDNRFEVTFEAHT